MENRNEVPEATPTEPDLSDADETLEIISGGRLDARHLFALPDDPVIRTLEVTEEDIVEVRAAVAAMEDDHAPLRTQPTQIIPRAALARKEPHKTSTLVMLFAAAGTWAFFVSLAGLGAFGAYSLFHAAAHPAQVVAAASSPAPFVLASVAPKRSRFIAEPVAPRARATEPSEDEQTSSRENATSSEETSHSSSRFGILHFAQSTNGALVDGSPRRVTGDAIFLSCGSHRIRTSRAGSRVVRVPCGKTVTL